MMNILAANPALKMPNRFTGYSRLKNPSSSLLTIPTNGRRTSPRENVLISLTAHGVPMIYGATDWRHAMADYARLESLLVKAHAMKSIGIALQNVFLTLTAMMA